MRCTAAMLACVIACVSGKAVPAVAAPGSSGVSVETPIANSRAAASWQTPVARQTAAAVDLAAWRAMGLQPGQVISVRLTDGEEVVGAFVSVTDAAVTLEVVATARDIPFSSVQRIALRNGQSRRQRGLFVGAAIGLLPGSGPCFSVKAGSNCAAGLLAGAAVGGVVGALMGSRASQTRIVYTSHAFPVAPASTRPVERVPAATRAPRLAPAASPGDLAFALTPFDTIAVGTDDGRQVTGRFVRVSESALTIERKGHPQEIGFDSVREVRRRIGTQVKRGAATGALAGMLLADVLLLSNSSADAKEVGASLVFGSIVGGVGGGVWGTIIGALTPRMELVYRTPAPSVRLQPILGASRGGALVSVQF